MVKLESLSWPVLLLVALCVLGSPGAVESQVSYTYTTGIPTPCVNTIVRYFVPNMASPTMQVAITKYLDTNRTCTWLMSNNADLCNPGMLAGSVNTGMLVASAFGTNITMMPSCQWRCQPTTVCGTSITTSGLSDGLPVELMDFGFEDEEAPETGGEGKDP